MNKEPDIDHLTAEIRDDRKGENKVAIIIASYKGNHILKEHLQYLKHQTFKKFDIVIVYGTRDEFLPTPKWASIVHIRRSRDFGSAMAYYTGEKFFLQEKYDMFIEADNYSFPQSKDIVEKLVRAIIAGNEYAYPKIKYRHTQIITVSASIRHYACVKRSLAERVGLAFAPFDMYAEDVEYSRRLLTAAKKHITVDTFLYRSYKIQGDFFVSNTYTYNKTKNNIILLRVIDRGFKKTFSLFLTFFSMFYVAVFNLLIGRREAFLEINRGILAGALLSMKEKKPLNTSSDLKTVMKADFDTVMVDKDTAKFYEHEKEKLQSVTSERMRTVFYNRDNAALEDPKLFFPPVLKIFGKRVVLFIYFGNFFIYTLAPFFCKKLYVYGDGSLVVVKDKDSYVYRAVFFLLFPVIVTLSVLLLLLSIFNPRKIETHGYGLVSMKNRIQSRRK